VGVVLADIVDITVATLATVEAEVEAHMEVAEGVVLVMLDLAVLADRVRFVSFGLAQQDNFQVPVLAHHKQYTINNSKDIIWA
jgi:hypothetical protein